MRISRQLMFMEIAHVVAKRSTCFRLNVGAIIVADNNIVSIGYNGVPSGAPHCTGHLCPGKDHCKLTIHAEENAIDRLSDLIVDYKWMYCTDSPCQSCAELIVGAGINSVVYRTPYRDVSPLDYLIKEGVSVHRVTASGYIIDQKTGYLIDAQ